MKKRYLFIIFIAAFILFLSTMVMVVNASNKSSGSSIEAIEWNYTDNSTVYSILRDNDTGIEYIVVTNKEKSAIAITPRYDFSNGFANGEIILYKE